MPSKAVHYYNKGKYYLAVGKTDSAEINFRKMLLPGRDPQQMEAGYRGLFLLYWHEEKWDSMAKYSNLQYEQVIPALADKNAERVQQIQGLYNYSRFEHKEKQTAEKNEQQKDIIIILLVALIALAIVAVCVGKLLGYALKRPVYDVKVNTPGNFISNEIHQKLSIKDNGQE